jgi:hypothetical protein
LTFYSPYIVKKQSLTIMRWIGSPKKARIE